MGFWKENDIVYETYEWSNDEYFNTYYVIKNGHLIKIAIGTGLFYRNVFNSYRNKIMQWFE